jgi:hypothetical protein
MGLRNKYCQKEIHIIVHAFLLSTTMSIEKISSQSVNENYANN